MRRILLLLSIALVAFAFNAQAASVVPNQLYQLLDHPDGSLTNLPDGVSYGVRVDALGGSAANRTFSTEQDGASVTLFWDGATNIVTITGQVSNNRTNELFDLNYVLQPATTAAGPDGGFEVLSDSLGFSATGTLSNGDITIDLVGSNPNNNNIFRALGDNHRCGTAPCVSDLVARGWIDVVLNGEFNDVEFDDAYFSRSQSVNDFLVQLQPVPIPAALPLLFSGMLGFSLFARKKSVS